MQTTIDRSETEALELVGQLAAIADRARDVDAALVDSLALICDFTGWQVGHVVLVESEVAAGTTIWHGAGGPAFREFREQGEELRVRAGEGLVGQCFRRRACFWIPDLWHDDGTFLRRPAAVTAGIRAGLAVPLVGGGEVVGVLELFRREVGEPPPALVTLLGVLCAELARMVERRRAAELIRASEERYRLLFDRATDAIFVVAPGKTFSAVNSAACALVGYTRDELLAMRALDLVAPEWRDLVENKADRKLAGAEPVSTYETVLVDRRGARVPVEIHSSVVADTPEDVAILAVVRDIGERKRAEAALRESEDRFRNAFETAHVGMTLVAVDGRLLKVNEAFCQMVGYGADELLELRSQDLTHPADRALDLSLFDRMLRGELASYQLEKRFLRRDGREVPVHVSVSLVRGEDGAAAYAVAQIAAIEAARPVAAEQPSPLSLQEGRALSAIAAGLSSAQTAELLGIGEETVQTYLRRAAAKLGAQTRAHAVATAIRYGFISTDGYRAEPAA